MAERKKTSVSTTEVQTPEYSKEQILASEKYRSNRDLVDAILDGEKKYTMETVSSLIEKYMKGKVK